MGVHGLWELLAPIGRRVSVETLAGKKLAIDASIWMIQFMKAMRDEKGEMIRNAHIVGFFRRICKLLFLRTKPVFVFDGGTPALKRRTVIARRRLRENAQAKVRKTAEKLLLNHLKAMRLKEISEDLKKQRQSTNDLKGKKAVVEQPNFEQETERGNDEGGMSYNQEELDAMLAASLAAEESEGFIGDASTSGSGVPLDDVFGDGDEDEDEDEEIILPEMHGKVDPAVLASLPPSMQLDLLVQMRERLMAENRQKYQKVKKAPEMFSELQIQSYLKTVAFRREIDDVRKSAAGSGIGGVQTSRIVSESNREFIFSSSFTGDKQAFTSAGQAITDTDQSQPPPVTSSSNAVNRVTPTKRDGMAAGPSGSETGKAFHDDVYERGNLRVSRVRALGIRMTRDLQRNLDLMKEMELEEADTNPKDGEITIAGNMVDVSGNSSDRILHQEATNMNNDGLNDEVEKIKEPALVKGTFIEVSFEDTHELQSGNEDDNLFASLVAGDPVMDFSVDNSAYEKNLVHSTSDFEWEEGVTEDKVMTIGNESDVEWEEDMIEDKTKVINDEGEVEWEEGFQDTELKSTSYAPQKDNTINYVSKGAQEQVKFQIEARSDEGEAVWEEGFQDSVSKFSSYAVENHNTVSKGAQEEETELQEAIRRSLEDVADQPEIAGDTVSDDIDWISALAGKPRPQVHASVEGASQPVEQEQQTNNLEIDCLEEKSAAAFVEVNFDESNLVSKLLSQDSGRSGSLVGEILSAAETVCEEKMLSRSGKPTMDNFIKDDNGCAVENYNTLAASSYASNLRPESLLDSTPVGAENMFRASLDNHSCETAKISASDSITDADELAKEKISGDFSMEKEESTIEPSFVDVDENHEVMDSRLEEELLFLDKEREELGNEQRKNERNAESVSTEMFVECQELLQMFGLPYIIAPMEAEAQCAFMELSNLVDGVVTDDSDAFLFGARSVYKNIFDDRKYVETYLMKDIENELGLNREKLLHMALLLGSDYTEGISGIGIVNAIEVINAFPEKDGLQKFQSWIESPDPTILGKLDVQAGGNNLKGKGSKEGISCDRNVPHPADDVERIKQTFMNKHRNVSKNWHIPSSFPSDAVISAYASPQVDKSTIPFSWGKPDLSVLRKLCWEKFGWGTSKADELLLPVLKEYNKHETQMRLEAFYTFNERFAKIRSKRITKALKGITGEKSSDLIDGTMAIQSGSRKKRKAKAAEDKTNQSGLGSEGVECAGTSNQISTMENLTPMKLRGRRTNNNISEVNLERCTNVNKGLKTKKKSCIRGRGRGLGRERERENKAFSGDSETSHDGSSSSERNGKLQSDISETPRRSLRVRNTVIYTVSDEFDDSDKESENRIGEGGLSKKSMKQAVEVNGTDHNELDEGTQVELEFGVSTDETEQVGQLDPNQVNDNSDQIQLPKDYLQSGGGFCMDEDEELEIDGCELGPTEEAIPNFMGEENNKTDVLIRNEEALNECDLQNPSDGDFGNRSFRAMPNLRRKKRKT